MNIMRIANVLLVIGILGLAAPASASASSDLGVTLLNAFGSAAAAQNATQNALANDAYVPTASGIQRLSLPANG